MKTNNKKIKEINILVEEAKAESLQLLALLILLPIFIPIFILVLIGGCEICVEIMFKTPSLTVATIFIVLLMTAIIVMLAWKMVNLSESITNRLSKIWIVKVNLLKNLVEKQISLIEKKLQKISSEEIAKQVVAQKKENENEEKIEINLSFQRTEEEKELFSTLERLNKFLEEEEEKK